MNREVLGSFEVVSGKVRITDPCYSPDTWCSGELKNVRKGRWKAQAFTKEVPGWGNRVWELEVFAESGSLDFTVYEKLKFEVGVDSGQAGIFDSSHYQDATIVPKDARVAEYIKDDKWYAMCCAASHNENTGLGAGVVPYGVNSSSGFGDGSYDAYAKYDPLTKEVIAIKIIFISDKVFEREEEYA
jgi:hypothetical protein